MNPIMIFGAAALLGTAALGAPAGSRAVPLTDFPMVLSGSVTDSGGAPMDGVAVRLFVGGGLTAATRTDSGGSYLLEFSIDSGRDETIAVWWISPRTDLVSELALIRESEADRRLGLWSPCVPRIGIQRRNGWSVRLLDRRAVRRELARSGCGR